MVRAAAIALPLVLALGCQRSGSEGPVEAWRGFQLALKRGDAKAAWDGLSLATRSRLEARHKAVAAASGGVVKPEDAMQAALATGVRAPAAGEVKVKQTAGDTAVLEVSVGDRTAEQRMVREDGRWRLDLAPLLPEN